MVRFTEDDAGKTVVNPVGDDVGIVETVEDGTAYVEPSPGLTDRLRAALGWDDDPDATEYPLTDDKVASVTDDEVRLREDLSTDHLGVE